MEQIAVAPPPLPPKTRRSPPASATVLGNSAADVFSYKFPEVHGGHSQISSACVNTGGNHVVKIRINPLESDTRKGDTAGVVCDVAPCIRISVNSESDMIQSGVVTENFNKQPSDHPNGYFIYEPFNCNNVMSSGQVSPSDTLDSGTCSDLDGTPPPLPKKKNSGITITVNGAQHKRTSSSISSGAEIDSDDNESNVSYDSLNDKDLAVATTTLTIQENTVEHETRPDNTDNNSFLPSVLLQDIRQRSARLSEKSQEPEDNFAPTITSFSPKPTIVQESFKTALVNESTYEERKEQQKRKKEEAIFNSLTYDTDRFYDFHLNENNIDKASNIINLNKLQDDETFAGYKNILNGDGSSTIRSSKGTVRGVKNRVRAGIETFLQINSPTRSYKEKDAGKVVVYATTMGIVRETYNNCMKVKQILRTLLVKFEERDVFMSTEYQAEIRERMRCDQILVPQVFVDGQHVGDAETIERLNESGELRRILKPYKSLDACSTCKACGGYRLLPCPVCNGSKKSVHRNHFTTEFVALKCMNCDEVGLVRCNTC